MREATNKSCILDGWISPTLIGRESMRWTFDSRTRLLLTIQAEIKTKGGKSLPGVNWDGTKREGKGYFPTPDSLEGRSAPG